MAERAFGRARHALWKPFVAGLAAKVAVAYRQHLTVCALHDALEANNITVEALARRLGYHDVENLRRKLRGESWATNEDLTSWALAFPDRVILPEPHDLTPPVAAAS